MPTEHQKKETASPAYVEAIGRRKTAVARVRLLEGKAGSFVVGEQTLADYFKTDEQRRTAQEALALAEGAPLRYGVSAHLTGGGLSGQAEALRHGIARALVATDPELRKKLKKAGFLKRDPRAKERRKFGLKKARKAPQWSKR